MQKQLEEGLVDKVAIQKLAERLAAVHTATHVTTVTEQGFAQLRADFE